MGDTKTKYPGEDRWKRDVADIVQVTSHPRVGKTATIDGREVRFDAVMVRDLLRRRASARVLDPADVLKGRSYDGPAAGGGTPEYTSTEAAALSRLREGPDGEDVWAPPMPDPIGVMIEEALAELDTMARAARKFQRKLATILNAGAVLDGPEAPAGQCVVCDRPVARTDQDILHRGRYCGACNKQWQLAGRPHEVEETQWIAAQRAKLESEGKLWSQRGAPTFYEADELDRLREQGILPTKASA